MTNEEHLHQTMAEFGRQGARKRWANATPEQRKAVGEFLKQARAKNKPPLDSSSM